MLDSKTRKVAAITGATGAIGKEIAYQLAALDYSVIIIGRDPGRCASVTDEISTRSGNPSIDYRIADLSNRQSIENMAASWQGPLHVLINNAAIAPRKRLTTPQGIELQFATNVLGYYWMSQSLARYLSESSPSRIVNVASYWAGGLDLDDLEFVHRTYDNHAAYRQSKQANRMLSSVFSKKYQELGISVNACHPGDVRSTLSSDLGFGGSQSPSDGAITPVWLATSPSLEGVSGKYFEAQREVNCQFGALTHDAERLYTICSTYE